MSLCTAKHVAVITIFTPIYSRCTCNYLHLCHPMQNIVELVVILRGAHNFIARAVAIYCVHKLNGINCTVR